MLALTRALLITAALAVISIASAQATLIAGGNIINQTWTPAGSPYIVQGDITIPSGAFLTINAGTTVQFAGSDLQGAGTDPSRVEMTVNGTLSVNGTLAQPVTLLAQSGTSNVWVGIIVSSGATSASIHHALLEHSVSGIQYASGAGILTLDEVTLDLNGLDLVRNVSGGDPTITGTLSAGRFSGNVVIPSGATLALNRSNGVVQSGSFTLSGGSTYHTKLTSVGLFNQLQAAGSISLAGALDLDVSSLTASNGQTFKLIDNTGAGAVSGQFSGLPNGATFNVGAYWFQIAYNGGDGNDVVLTVVSPCDVAIHKFGPTSASFSGGGLDYLLAVANAGPATAHNVVVVDSLPTGLRYSSAVPSRGSCSQSGGKITCSLGDLAPSDSASIAVHATFSDTLAIANTATASTSDSDANQANNASSVTTFLLLGAVPTAVGPSPAAALGMQARPNPFQRTSRVFFRAAPGSRADLEIYDASGRLVRRMSTAVTDANGTFIEWDGRGDDGVSRQAGVFFYRLLVDGRVVGSERSVLVR